MDKITVMGMYIKKERPVGQAGGGTVYGNLLHYPGVLSTRMLEAEGFQFYHEAELPPEQADILYCVDLTPELWERVKAIPPQVHKILLACESPIYARLSHFASGVMMNPCWDWIMTWNRSYEADFIVHYDIPVAGKSVSEPLKEQPEITPEFPGKPGAVISSFNGTFA